MKKSPKSPKSPNFSILAALLAAPFVATAQTTIYSDAFDGSSLDNLLGTDAGGDTWGVSSGTASAFKADGSVVTAGSSSGIWLPVAIEQGNIYTLSADVDLTAGNWISLGYARDEADKPFTAGVVGAYGTTIVKLTSAQNFAGKGADGPFSGFSSADPVTGVVEFKIELDTTAAASGDWTMKFFESDVLRNTVTTENTGDYSEIGFVGFTTHLGNVTGTIGNFSFTEMTAVPEPSSFALLSGGIALVCTMVYRRRQSFLCRLTAGLKC